MKSIFDTSEFLPRAQCGHWGNWLSVYLFANIGICVAYVIIPLVMLMFSRRRKLGLGRKPLFVALFSTFIIFCGIGHLLDAMTFYWPAYKFLSLWHLGTMVVSWPTAILLPRLLIHYELRDQWEMTGQGKTATQTRLRSPDGS